MTDTYTNTVDSEIHLPDISRLNQIYADAQSSIAKTFMGLPVRLDPELKGNEHYLCISEEMLMEIAGLICFGKDKQAKEVVNNEQMLCPNELRRLGCVPSTIPRGGVRPLPNL